MAGHSTLHPYLKTFDEMQRSVRRMETYLKIYGNNMDPVEKEGIQTIIENLTEAINFIPEEYQVSRWKQFNSKDE